MSASPLSRARAQRAAPSDDSVFLRAVEQRFRLVTRLQDTAAGRNRTSRFTACRTPEARRHLRRILLAVDRPHAAKEVVSTAKTYGASVILITDESLSPSAEEADIVLPVAVDGIPFDSLAALLVLTESLVAAVFHGVGDGAIERMADWERSVRIHRVGHSLSRP